MKFEQNESPNESNSRKFSFLMITMRKGILFTITYIWVYYYLWTGVLIEIENRVMRFFSKRFFICYSRNSNPYWNKYSCISFNYYQRWKSNLDRMIGTSQVYEFGWILLQCRRFCRKNIIISDDTNSIFDSTRIKQKETGLFFLFVIHNTYL